MHTFTFRKIILLSLALAGLPNAFPETNNGKPDSVTILDLVREIVTNNPERRFYEAEIAASESSSRIARSLDDPEISFDIGRKRVKDAQGAFVAEGTAWTVSVSQTFEWPGRLSLRKAIANQDIEIARTGLARFETALSARARQLAFGLYAANAKAVAIREVAERYSELKETFLARDPSGIGPLLETRVIEAAEISLQRRASAAAQELHAALMELNQLRGLSPDTPVNIQAAKLKFNPLPDNSSLVIAARENNFEFKIRRLELEQQGYAVRLARNERYPSFTLSPYYSREKAGDRETTLGISLSMPLPVSSRSRHSAPLAEARKQQAETALLIAQQQMDREVLSALNRYSSKYTEIQRWPSDSITRFQDAAALADRHYRLGAVNISTYTELQDSYLDAVESLLDTELEALESGLSIEELCGVNLNLVELAQ